MQQTHYEPLKKLLIQRIENTSDNNVFTNKKRAGLIVGDGMSEVLVKSFFLIPWYYKREVVIITVQI